MRFKLKSECIEKKQAEIIIWAIGPSIGIGIKLAGSMGSIGFEDNDNKINANNFNGPFVTLQAGLTHSIPIPIRPPHISTIGGFGKGLGPGVGASFIMLGSVFSDPLKPIGFIGGRDCSASLTIGSSTVTDVKITCCKDKQ